MTSRRLSTEAPADSGSGLTPSHSQTPFCVYDGQVCRTDVLSIVRRVLQYLALGYRQGHWRSEGPGIGCTGVPRRAPEYSRFEVRKLAYLLRGFSSSFEIVW